MAWSVKQKVENEIEKIESRIKPEMDRLEELKMALGVITSLPDPDESIVTVAWNGSDAPKRKINRRVGHKPRTRYGDKSLPEYITEIGMDIQPFSSNDLRIEMKKRYGFNVKISSISAALSVMHLKHGAVRRIKMGLYTMTAKTINDVTTTD